MMMSAQVESWRNMNLHHVPYTLAGYDTPWVLDARISAFERFFQHGFPARRDEEWKYTDVTSIGRRTTLAPDIIPAEPSSDAKLLAWTLAGEGMHLMVFVNGHYDAMLSTVGNLPHGVRLESLAKLLDNGNRFPEKFFDQHYEHTVFSSLNNAFATGGAVVVVPANVVLEAPVYLLFIASGHGEAIYPRNIIIAGENSQATIIEHYMGTLDIHNFTNAITQLDLATGARVEHCKLMQEGPAATHIGGIHAEQAAASELTTHSFALGCHLGRNDITVKLQGRACHSTLNGLYMLNERQHMDHHTQIDHLAENCVSREYYRGVLDGASHGVFNGKVIVHAGAYGTDAHQANHNLLLSRLAEVDTKPQLEIFADDVKCTHGATVGQLGEDQLFYLRSRGIDADLARSVMIYGFANDIISRVGEGSLRTHIEHMLLDRLPQGELVKGLL
jgi:Fe-S cluster assembly protein SufD